nr:hypothetical protein [Tanacetum cinerariifolium]
MLNKDNYVPWSSRIIRYARSRLNGKMIVDSIENGPYVRLMIATPREPDLPVPVPESLHEQTDEELIETNIKRMDADDQAIQTILLGLPEDNFMPPPMTSLEDINDPTEAMNAALILFAKAFQLFAPTNNNQRTSSNPHNCQNAQPVMNMGQDRQIQNVGRNSGNHFGQYVGQVAQNQQGFNAWKNGGIQGAQNAGVQSDRNQNGLVVVPEIVNQSGNGNVVAARAEGTGIGNQARDATYLQTLLLIAQKEEAGFQLQAEEFDFMAAACDLDEIEEVNANCILMANLQQASTSGTQHDRALVYDTDGSAEVHLNDNCYDNEIFNMFTQEEQYRDLLEPIPEPQLVPQNDNHVTSVAPSMVHSGGTIETSSAPNEEICAHQEAVYRNLVDQVAQVNRVNSNMRATNAELKSELARYKIQEQRVEITKFVRDFKSLVKEADESLDKQKSLELEIERLLKASVSHDIMSIVQNSFVDVSSDLRTELDRTKEKLELCIIKKEKEYVVLWNNCLLKATDAGDIPTADLIDQKPQDPKTNY